MYTSDISPDVLIAHGRLRLLRKMRNDEAQRLRKACEQMHTALLAVIRSLDANSLHQPLTSDFRVMYRRARYAERELEKIDQERRDVEQGL